jgi:hypothetical protein
VPARSVAPEGTLTLPNTRQQRRRLREVETRGANGVLRHCLSAALAITGRVDVDVLRDALVEVVQRRPALRARFTAGTDEHVILATTGVELDEITVDGPTPADRWHAAHEIAAERGMRPFPVGATPLLRACLVDAGERRLLVLTVDQLACDAWSANLILDELIATADARARGETAAETQPDDYVTVTRRRVAWLDSERGQAAVARRRAALAGTEAGWMWTADPRATGAGELVQRKIVVPDGPATAFLEAVRRTGGSVFAAALAALVAAGGRGPGTRLSVSSTFACRENRAEENTVGWLSNEVRLPVPAVEGTIADFLGAVRGELLAGLTDQRVPSDEPDEGADRLSVSLMYLPPQLNGGDRTTTRIGAAQCERNSVSVCPTGADLDLFVAERPAPLSDSDRPLLLLGGTADPSRVPARRLEQVLDSWLAALTQMSGTDWHTVSLNQIGWRAAG